ncbi:hypothetical protein BDR07DRAFT_1490588 [Suillus spraguei]|nr:hypothetical protein BDR07DRAFT_1490588 [Suillus spraguei]
MSRSSSNGPGSQSQTAVSASRPHDNLQSAMSDESLDEPIIAGVCRHKADSSPSHGDPTVLTPVRTKRLKVYGLKVAEDLGIGEEELHEFIDTGGIYYMLIDIKATLLRWNDDTRNMELTQLKELLDSKDFKCGIQNHLTACMLSPNITAYVTDAHFHIMDIVREHHDVFKIPVAMLQDVELNVQLSKLVSNLLCSIWGNIKAKQCCLRIFLIGVDDYKTVSLSTLFSNSLISSLHQDLRVKINQKLNIDIDAIEHGMHGNINQDIEPDAPAADIEGYLDKDQPMHDMENADNGAEDEYQGEEDLPAVSEGNSGFKGKGHCAVYSPSKFWKLKFIDDSLHGIRKLAKTQVSEQGLNSSLTYEHAFCNILVEYFQLDLAEFPGKRVVPKLLSTTCPQWQTTIQNKLLCEI